MRLRLQRRVRGVLDEHAVDPVAAGGDREVGAGRGDREAGAGERAAGGPEHVGDPARAQVLGDVGALVRVGVEGDPALLLVDAAPLLRWVEAEAGEVALHSVSFQVSGISAASRPNRK